MNRLTARTEKGLAYLVNVKPDEQAVDSPHKNTLQCILDCFERLAHYEDLEEQGRLAVLPCKVGDVAFTIEKRRNDHGSHDRIIIEHTVIAFIFDGAPIPFLQITGDNGNPNVCGRYIRVDAIGTLVFLTREEAEAALAGQKGE